jgi:hypothetical protein
MQCIGDDCFELLCCNDGLKGLMRDGWMQLTFFFCLSNITQDPTCTTHQIDQNLLPKSRSNGILMPNGLKSLK